MNNISFQGNFIRKVDINKLGLDGVYKPIKASLVELTHDDVVTAEKVVSSWNVDRIVNVPKIIETYIAPPDIMKLKSQAFLDAAKHLKEEDVPGFLSSRIIGDHAYAVTTQCDNFEKLEPDSILGLAMLSAKPHGNSLDTLEVRPDCISEKYGNQVLRYLKSIIRKLFKIQEPPKTRPYSHVGDAIIKSLQKMYNDKTMELVPLNDAKSFYRKYGFSLNPQTGFDYIWYPDYRG